MTEPIFGNHYKIIWTDMSNKPKMPEGVLGVVRNFTNDNHGYRDIKLIKSDLKFESTYFRFMSTSWTSKGPIIYLTDKFMSLPVTIKESFIWHEVGHIHHKHMLKRHFKDQAELRNYRLCTIKKNIVDPFELEADIFAINRVGKTAFIKALRFLMETRSSGSTLNDMGRRELELRIQKIIKMN
jgi:hypothetical protein